ncbi:cupin domain-containing protein [Streptomyces macrosporus]|uniref:Cupin type-2 domain-containing protein n=1 Tax=Streptomyces macrosporus TaxID=44032 RepID=A0ABP5XRR7_9ACTN
MITKLRIDQTVARAEFGMRCQRLVPWSTAGDEPPLGAMACFLEPGASSAPDCHDQDEVMIVLSGDGTVELAGESTRIGTGEVVVLPRNREHVVHNPAAPGATTLTWVSVYWPLHEPTPGAAS